MTALGRMGITLILGTLNIQMTPQDILARRQKWHQTHLIQATLPILGFCNLARAKAIPSPYSWREFYSSR